MRRIFAFSDRDLGSVAEWEQAIDAQGFALHLSGDRPTDELREHMPARFRNEDAGFDFDQPNSAELMARYPDVDFGHAWKFVRAFRMGPNFKGHVAVLAKVTGGKVFDPESGKLCAPEEMLGILRELERDVLQLEGELKRLKERPGKALTPSPAVISVRLWKEEPEGSS